MYTCTCMFCNSRHFFNEITRTGSEASVTMNFQTQYFKEPFRTTNKCRNRVCRQNSHPLNANCKRLFLFCPCNPSISLRHDNMSVHYIPPYTPLLNSKTGIYRGIPIFLIFAPKRRLWVLVTTASARRF